jgi:diketogulonate reductase-like aldo/keto reductase
MIVDERYKLNNGQRIPKVALGTWQVSDDEAEAVVEASIAAGYRHIDTAIAYGNEAGVGRGIRAAMDSLGLHRESIFVTSKIPAEVKTHEGTVACIQESMDRLDCFHVDMMLIHAPKPWDEMGKPGNNYYAENLEVWKALEDAYAAGKFRAIGVSNFDVDDLKNIMDECTVMPAVNQVRVHIGHVPYEVIEFCEQNGILVEAYSPNAHGNLANIPVICQMAAKYDVSVPQLASRFILQLGLLPLPKSTHGERILQNADLDFEIMPADMAELLEIDGL